MQKATSNSLDGFLQGLNIPKFSRTPGGWKGCCVINEHHHDRNPSMHISVEKGHVKCFSCGAYRPLFAFLVENGLPFDEAVPYLMFHEKTERQNHELTEYRLGYCLPKSMLDRGFTEETLDFFEVGYDPHEGRITIPLYWQGTLVGVCYREYPKKFWYSDGFIRDQYIYNYAPTKERIYVEGFTDCWAVHQYGFENVSGYLGGEPSDTQIEMMRKHDKIILAVDMDAAGFKGALKIEEALGLDVEIEVVPMPKKDAAACGKEVFLQSYKKRTTITQFKVAILKHKPEIFDNGIRRNQKLAPENGA